MIIGYVFSRTGNREFPIARAGPEGNAHNEKLYTLLKKYVFKELKNE